MNAQETYLFDLQGYITVPDALSAEQLVTLNAIWEERMEKDITPEQPNHRWGNLFEWGQPFLDLIDQPTIVPYLNAILGKNFRLDHEYADLIRTGKSPIGSTLQGGGAPFYPGQYYH